MRTSAYFNGRFFAGVLLAVLSIILDIRYGSLHWGLADDYPLRFLLNDMMTVRTASVVTSIAALYLLITNIVIAHRLHTSDLHEALLWLVSAPFIAVALIPVLTVT